jgi:hypothetical protein
MSNRPPKVLRHQIEIAEELFYGVGKKKEAEIISQAKSAILLDSKLAITDAILESGDAAITVNYFWSVSHNHDRRTVTLTADITPYSSPINHRPNYVEKTIAMLEQLAKD